MMVTAKELLSKHLHDVIDADTYFVINPITRKLETATRSKNVVMQYDHDSERFTFELPRIVEGHDMLLCNSVLVHWNNVDGSTGEETAESTDIYDLRVNPDNEESVICSWLISRNATQRVGILSFLVQYKCVDENGDATYEWHTDIYENIEIRKSRNNGPQSIIEYSDILEQWRTKLFGVGDTEEARLLAVSQEQQTAISEQGAATLSDIELKGSETLNTIPDDYTTVYNMAEEAIRTKADAIVLSAEGESIILNNASNDHLQNLKLYGRTIQANTTGIQLFDAYAEQNNSFGNATVENDGAKITVTGSYYVSWPIVLKAGVKYYVDFKASGDTESRAVRFEYPDKAITNTITNPSTFTPTQDTVSVYLYSGLGTEGTVIYENVQISEGSTALPWEPYTGGVASPSPDYPQELVSVENPTIAICGKNIIPYPYINTSIISNGITFTANSDGTVTANGTATGTAYFPLQSISSYSDVTPIPRGEYVLSGAPTEYCRVAIGLWKNEKRSITYSAYVHQPYNFVINEDNIRFDIVCTVDTGVTLNNAVFKPQLELGRTPTQYEPYKSSQTITLSRTLPGIPVSAGGNYTDENGQQWISDEVDSDRGVYVQRVFGENVAFEYQVDLDRYTANLSNTASTSYAIGNGIILLCDKLIFDSIAGSGTPKVNGIRIAFTSPNKVIAYYNGEVIDSAYVLYPLATPIETPLTSEELLAYKALKTNYPNTTIVNDYGAHMIVKYNADTLIFLRDNQPKPTDEQVATAVNAYLAETGVQVPSDDYIKALIDAHIKGVSPAKIGTVTLPASAWVGSNSLYSQVVNIDGVTENSQVDLTPDVEQLAIFHDKDITFVTENDGGTVTVYAIGQKPENDYTIQVTIMEVYV